MIGLAYIQGFDDLFGAAPHQGSNPSGTPRVHSARAPRREAKNTAARTPINRNTGRVIGLSFVSFQIQNFLFPGDALFDLLRLWGLR